jgi:hypothetical protein
MDPNERYYLQSTIRFAHRYEVADAASPTVLHRDPQRVGAAVAAEVADLGRFSGRREALTVHLEGCPASVERALQRAIAGHPCSCLLLLPSPLPTRIPAFCSGQAKSAPVKPSLHVPFRLCPGGKLSPKSPFGAPTHHVGVVAF